MDRLNRHLCKSISPSGNPDSKMKNNKTVFEEIHTSQNYTSTGIGRQSSKHSLEDSKIKGGLWDDFDRIIENFGTQKNTKDSMTKLMFGETGFLKVLGRACCHGAPKNFTTAWDLIAATHGRFDKRQQEAEAMKIVENTDS